MIKGKAEISFGTGDIRISPILNDCEGMCILDNQTPHEIGEKEECKDEFTVRGKDVMIRFSNVESLEVLIKSLEELKQLMLGERPEGSKDMPNAMLDGFWE